MSARSLVLLNARVSSVVFTLQLFFPARFYDSHLSRLVSHWTGLRHVKLEEANSPAHSFIIAFHLVVLVHIWMAATSTRKHAHASTALMEILFATAALLSCSPLFPPAFGSSIALISAIPNLIFGVGICRAGNIGLGDMVGLFQGDEGIRERDRVRVD